MLHFVCNEGEMMEEYDDIDCVMRVSSRRDVMIKFYVLRVSRWRDLMIKLLCS